MGQIRAKLCAGNTQQNHCSIKLDQFRRANIIVRIWNKNYVARAVLAQCIELRAFDYVDYYLFWPVHPLGNYADLRPPSEQKPTRNLINQN